MTTTNPRTRILARRAFAVGLAAIFGLAGCKSTDGSASKNKPGDPLVFGPSRIPPQNVPLPDRAVANPKGGKSDPLFDRPVGRTGAGYSDDPERFKGTYIPGPNSTPAAMAAKKNTDSDELKIAAPADNRVPLRSTGGGVEPAGASEVASNTEALYAELAKYGGKPLDRPVQLENGTFSFRASVPNTANGTQRQYEGIGATAAEAVKQVLEQVAADRK